MLSLYLDTFVIGHKLCCMSILYIMFWCSVSFFSYYTSLDDGLINTFILKTYAILGKIVSYNIKFKDRHVSNSYFVFEVEET